VGPNHDLPMGNAITIRERVAFCHPVIIRGTRPRGERAQAGLPPGHRRTVAAHIRWTHRACVFTDGTISHLSKTRVRWQFRVRRTWTGLLHWPRFRAVNPTFDPSVLLFGSLVARLGISPDLRSLASGRPLSGASRVDPPLCGGMFWLPGSRAQASSLSCLEWKPRVLGTRGASSR
jgi:hypothetical protein